jgi:shikimate dehydrogenase
MKISLIGFMGSGKTTVAELLADRLALKWIEIDQLVEKRAGSSIAKLIEQRGEEEFRHLESEVVQAQDGVTGAVISCGGGVVGSEKNLAPLKTLSGIIVSLETKFESIQKRLAHDFNRPLFRDKIKARQLFDLRCEIYKRWSDIQVSTDDKTPEQVSSEVIYKLFKSLQTSKLNLVIGDPIAHSLTPKLHSEVYRDLGIHEQFLMLPLKVNESLLAQTIKKVRELSVSGLAVTMPLKVRIAPLLDELDTHAKTIGAVNTVVNREGKLVGFNTDWLGVRDPLLSAVNLKDAKVLVLGAGGAAQAACYGVQEAGAHVALTNRSAELGERVAQQFGVQFRLMSELTTLQDFDVIINCTAAGMGSSTESPIDCSLLSPQQLVFETIYSPRETTLLKAAKSIGCRVIDGLEMFVHQAAAQIELHTGKRPQLEMMRAVLQ